MTATAGTARGTSAQQLLAEFLAAKASLDAAPRGSPTRPAAWLALCTATSRLGRQEAAYTLYARAVAECRGPGARALAEGQLAALAALAAPPPRALPGPTAAAAAASASASSASLPPEHLARYTERYWRDGALPRSAARVFAASDLHVDKPGAGHMAWVAALSGEAFKRDVLIVAGASSVLRYFDTLFCSLLLESSHPAACDTPSAAPDCRSCCFPRGGQTTGGCTANKAHSWSQPQAAHPFMPQINMVMHTIHTQATSLTHPLACARHWRRCAPSLGGWSMCLATTVRVPEVIKAVSTQQLAVVLTTLARPAACRAGGSLCELSNRAHAQADLSFGCTCHPALTGAFSWLRAPRSFRSCHSHVYAHALPCHEPSELWLRDGGSDSFARLMELRQVGAMSCHCTRA